MQHAINILGELRRGACNEELSEAIREAVKSVIATGKKAEVMVKLKFEPAGIAKGDRETEVERVWLTDEIKLSVPKVPVAPSIFFIDPENQNLSRTPPQLSIPGVQDPSQAESTKTA